MKHKDDLRQGLEAGKELYKVGIKLVGRGIDRGTRLFGENPRPNRNAGYFQ